MQVIQGVWWRRLAEAGLIVALMVAFLLLAALYGSCQSRTVGSLNSDVKSHGIDPYCTPMGVLAQLPEAVLTPKSPICDARGEDEAFTHCWDSPQYSDRYGEKHANAPLSLEFLSDASCGENEFNTLASLALPAWFVELYYDNPHG